LVQRGRSTRYVRQASSRRKSSHTAAWYELPSN